MVQDEAELIRVDPALGSLPFGVDDARSQTCHHRVIHHRTNLRNIETCVEDVGKARTFKEDVSESLHLWSPLLHTWL